MSGTGGWHLGGLLAGVLAGWHPGRSPQTDVVWHDYTGERPSSKLCAIYVASTAINRQLSPVATTIWHTEAIGAQVYNLLGLLLHQLQPFSANMVPSL